MDSKHRHELRENDLYDSLTHAREMWNKYGNGVLLIVLVVAGFFAVQRLIRVTREQAHESRWSDLALTTSPEAYRSIAQASGEPSVQALALLRGADLLLHRAALPAAPTPPTTQPAEGAATPPAPATPVSAQDRKRMIEDAALMYEQVLAIQDVNPVFAGNARLGLASVAENRGDFAKARELYEKVKAEAGETYAGIKAQAEGRLQVLDRLNRPVRFATAAVTIPAPPADGVPPLLSAPTQTAPITVAPAAPTTPATTPAAP